MTSSAAVWQHHHGQRHNVSALPTYLRCTCELTQAHMWIILTNYLLSWRPNATDDFFNGQIKQQQHSCALSKKVKKKVFSLLTLMMVFDSGRVTNQSAVRTVVGWLTWMSRWEKSHSSCPAARLFSRCPSTKDGAGHFVSNTGVPLLIYLPVLEVATHFLTFEVSLQRCEFLFVCFFFHHFKLNWNWSTTCSLHTMKPRHTPNTWCCNQLTESW